jgi:hypothetical protein
MPVTEAYVDRTTQESGYIWMPRREIRNLDSIIPATGYVFCEFNNIWVCSVFSERLRGVHVLYS